MLDDGPELKPECAETRKLFHLAFIEPAAEEEIMLHASRCLECMDAFLELKDTVKQLETAATLIPAVDDFSSRVFARIDQEEKNRLKRSRIIAVVAVAFFAGAALAFAVAVPLNQSRDTRKAETPEIGTKKSGAGDDSSRTSKEEPDPAADEPPAIPDGTELKPGDEPPPASDNVDKIIESILSVERDPPDFRAGQRGRQGARMRSLMHRISLLDQEERSELLKKLEKEPVSGRFPHEGRFRAQLIDRVKSMPTNGLRRHGNKSAPAEKKN